MSNSTLHFRTFGPHQTIGLSYIAGNGNCDFLGVWDRLFKRLAGVVDTQGKFCFGICRCIPGVTDGTWEYVAAVEAAPETAVPDGFVRVQIAQCEYAVLDIENPAAIADGWKLISKLIAATPGREPYCGPNGCACATHPGFECSAPDSSEPGRLAIYVPVKRV